MLMCFREESDIVQVGEENVWNVDTRATVDNKFFSNYRTLFWSHSLANVCSVSCIYSPSIIPSQRSLQICDMDTTHIYYVGVQDDNGTTHISIDLHMQVQTGIVFFASSVKAMWIDKRSND